MEPLPHQLVNCKITTHTALLYALSPFMKAALIQEPELAAHAFSTLRPCGTGSLDRSSPKSQGKPQHHDKTEMHTLALNNPNIQSTDMYNFENSITTIIKIERIKLNKCILHSSHNVKHGRFLPDT